MKNPRKNLTSLPVQTVALERIENGAGPFCMSFGYDAAPLIRSIGHIGLVHAPLVMEGDSGVLTIISGYRRIRALMALDQGHVPCRVVEKNDLEPLEALLINLHDNLATRRLNETEKAMALERLARVVHADDLVETYMPLLGLPSHKPLLKAYLRIVEMLGERELYGLARGHITVKTAEALADEDPANRESLFQLITTLHLNGNQQKQWIELLMDLTRICQQPLADIIRAVAGEEGFETAGIQNRPQWSKTILRRLRLKRFPHLVRAEDRFRGQVSRLNPPKGVRISAPPFFESPDFRLEVQFRHGRELKEKIERLTRTAGLEDLDVPWKEES